jgi:hypothetical protein
MCGTRSWHTYEMHLVSLRKSDVTIPSSSASQFFESLMISSRSTFLRDECRQHCPHISASTILGDKELLKGETTRPLLLNADSEATVDTCTTRTSLASLDNTGYLPEFTFHQFKMSNCSVLFSHVSFRYLNNSELIPLFQSL